MEGLDDERLRKKLLLEPCEGPLMFEIAVKLARKSSVAASHIHELGGQTTLETVNKVYKRKEAGSAKRNRKSNIELPECDYCGVKHE